MTWRAKLDIFRPCLRHCGVSFLTALITLWGPACTPVVAAEHGIAVVVSKHSAVTALTREQVADIFLGRAVSDTKWKPIDSGDEALREAFYQAVAGLSANRVRAHWARLVFSARMVPPREMTVEQAMAATLREDTGIAYVSSEQVPKDARVLLILP